MELFKGFKNMEVLKTKMVKLGKENGHFQLEHMM